MDSLKEEFHQDLDDLLNTLGMLSKLDSLPSLKIAETLPEEDELIVSVTDLIGIVKKGKSGIVKLPGILVLYIAGRFEDFVRTLFEELAIRISSKYSKFKELPKSMQEALIQDSSEVISNPRKYGHGEGARNTFIKNLYQNIHKDDLNKINHQCISITESNMRAEILGDLFKKIGIKEIWKKIGEQSSIHMFFKTDQNEQAQKLCSMYLNDFMNERNKIAHPSGQFNWPSSSKIEEYISFFRVLSSVLTERCKVHEMKIASNLDAGED